MKITDELKEWYICRKEGRMEEYKAYKKNLELYKSDIQRISGYIENAKSELEKIQAKFPKDSDEYNKASDEVNRWQQALDDRKLRINFMRPNRQEDIDYRMNQLGNEYSQKLQEVISPHLDLRFHGTPIYFAEQILKSKSISSTADRYDGYVKSTDMKGEISASTVKSIGRTIDFFSDIASYQSCLPAGCIFALLPKDEADANYGYDLMKAVDFKKNPEQLFGVFTTPENIEITQKWMSQNGFDSSRVFTFEQFIEEVKEKSKIIDEKYNDKSINSYEANNSNITSEVVRESQLFGKEDIKEMAMQSGINGRKISKINLLYEKIKNLIKGNKEKSNDKDDKGIGEK